MFDTHSSKTTMGYVFPLIQAVHVQPLEDDGYYALIVVEEVFLQDSMVLQ